MPSPRNLVLSKVSHPVDSKGPIHLHWQSMKRTVLYILLLANLFSGLALAWDSHPEAMAGHEAPSFDRAEADGHSHGQGGSPAVDREHANHCCHGTAHLIGFIHEPATPLLLAGGKFPLLPTAPLLSPPIALHLRPPIV